MNTNANGQKPVKDWTGRDVPPPTGPEDVYPVWSVETTPALSRHDTTYLVRGWQDFLSFLRQHFEDIIDGFDEEKARAGVTFAVKLIDMREEDFPTDD